MTEFGGVDVQEIGWTPRRERMREAFRVVIGIALLMLVTGVWVCLWVPSSL